MSSSLQTDKSQLMPGQQYEMKTVFYQNRKDLLPDRSLTLVDGFHQGALDGVEEWSHFLAVRVGKSSVDAPFTLFETVLKLEKREGRRLVFEDLPLEKGGWNSVVNLSPAHPAHFPLDAQGPQQHPPTHSSSLQAHTLQVGRDEGVSVAAVVTGSPGVRFAATRQAGLGNAKGALSVNLKVVPGISPTAALQQGYSHVAVHFLFTEIRASFWKSKVKPPRRVNATSGRVSYGVFATCSPTRPTGYSVVPIDSVALKTNPETSAPQEDHKRLNSLPIHKYDMRPGTMVLGLNFYQPQPLPEGYKCPVWVTADHESIKITFSDHAESQARGLSLAVRKELETLFGLDPRTASQKKKSHLAYFPVYVSEPDQKKGGGWNALARMTGPDAAEVVWLEYMPQGRLPKKGDKERILHSLKQMEITEQDVVVNTIVEKRSQTQKEVEHQQPAPLERHQTRSCKRKVDTVVVRNIGRNEPLRGAKQRRT